MPDRSFLSNSDLQKMSGTSGRTISRALKAGDIPGAYRHDNLHWRIPMSPSVLAWCKDQKRRQKLLAMPKGKLNTGLGKGTSIVTIEGIRQWFDIWKRKTDIEKWTISDIDRAILLLEPFADYLQSLRSMRENKTARILR